MRKSQQEPLDLAEAIARLRALTSRTDQWYDSALDVLVLELEARNSESYPMTPGVARVDEELTIEDWSWSQVPPPLLSVVTNRGRVVLGLADPANGVDENGWLEWTPRRLTPDQADRLADDLHARVVALRAAAAEETA